MVKLKPRFEYLTDGHLDVEAWLKKIKHHYQLTETHLIENAIHLAKNLSEGLTTFYGQSCLEKGLEVAEIILDLKLDQDAVAAAILTSTIQHTHLKSETITEKLNENVTKLMLGVLQMNIFRKAAEDQSKNSIQIDRLRKAFLAMASDIRVIIIKLAERTCIMRGIKSINPSERKRLAQETMDIYAPLANRLGIGQLKWELEDLAFHYIDPDTYKKIAHFLAERRMDREARIDHMINQLKEQLSKVNVKAEITGRAKHIYSIF